MGSDSETEKIKEKKKLNALAPIAKPLAGKKLCKRTLKLVRRAAEGRCMKRGVKEVVKSIRRQQKGDPPQLIALLKEMKDGLDTVRIKVQDLTRKVNQNQLPTTDGMSYLEAKHLLLLGYCQSIVYYLLRKAKGLSIDGHPVVCSLVEIRMFLEKIRPIDKKLEYQLQRLTRSATNAAVPEELASNDASKKDVPRGEDEDHLKYRPNPEMLVPKAGPRSEDGGDGVYRPPRFAPTAMDEDKMSKQEKLAMRRDKELVRRSKQSSYMKDIIDDLEDRPEELREDMGVESRELMRYLEKREKRDRQEEELFTRAPITKKEKKIEKQMKRSRGGVLGLTDHFFDEMKTFPSEEKADDAMTSYMNTSNRGKRFKKHKRRH